MELASTTTLILDRTPSARRLFSPPANIPQAAADLILKLNEQLGYAKLAAE